MQTWTCVPSTRTPAIQLRSRDVVVVTVRKGVNKPWFEFGMWCELSELNVGDENEICSGYFLRETMTTRNSFPCFLLKCFRNPLLTKISFAQNDNDSRHTKLLGMVAHLAPQFTTFATLYVSTYVRPYALVGVSRPRHAPGSCTCAFTYAHADSLH